MAKPPARRRPGTRGQSPAARPSGPGAPVLAESVAALRALAHPMRLRLLELFAEQPRTTKQVAELLGEPPTRLYHHVNALERAGLLELRETRANRGATEKWYAARPQRATALHREWSAHGSPTEVPRALAGTILTQGQQEMVAALADPSRVLAPLLMRVISVGPPDRQASIRQRLHAFVLALAEEGKDAVETTGEPERWAVTIVMAPVAPPPRASRAR